MQPKKMRMQLAAEELLDEIDRLLPAVKRGNPKAADHLERAAQSTLFNIAEGIAAWRPKVKLDRYEIGRREVNEVRAILRRLVRQRVLTRDEARRGYNLCGAIVGMLTNAAIQIEKRRDNAEA